ncbi:MULTISPECIES: hypothetical protein [Hyphobacterium]|uniref:Energy transducer TonB n=1 Tax=Hyphobacterium vulgare TaxID=1736751 RepID=A0ABV6ZZG4_9PROT
MADLARTMLSRHQRLAAIGGGALINALLIFGLIRIPPGTIERFRVIDVTFIVPAAELEPEIVEEAVPEPVVEDIPPDPEPVAERPPETPVPAQSQPAPSNAPVSARSVDEAPESPPSGERDVYAVSPGTRSVLSGLQCPGDPEGFARTGVCGETARRTARIEVPEEDMLAGFDLSTAQIRALFGDSDHIYAGQPTLDSPAARRNLSTADQMRDALPASRPDPAFGD